MKSLPEAISSANIQNLSSCQIKNVNMLKLVPGTQETKAKIFDNLMKVVDWENIGNSPSSAFTRIVIPAIQREIERTFFEKIFWSSAVKKLGGMLEGLFLQVVNIHCFNW